jgi:hypothetical protein
MNLLNPPAFCFNSSVPNIVVDDILDCDISIDEIFHVLKLAKTGKSPGDDELPVELLKNQIALSALVHIFNVCYTTGKVPSLWSNGVSYVKLFSQTKVGYSTKQLTCSRR